MSSSITIETGMGCQENSDSMATPDTKTPDPESCSMPANTNGSSGTSSQPDSPLSSDMSTKPSSQTSSDNEAPVLTPVCELSDSKKRKADDDPEETPGGDLEQTEVKKPKLEEYTELDLKPDDAESKKTETSDPTKDTVEEGNVVKDHEEKSDSSLNSSIGEDLSMDVKNDSAKMADSSKPGINELDKISGSDSDKENANAPMDLSVGLKSNGVSDAVDEESAPLYNGFKELTPEEARDRRRLVKQLQDELRNEEAKLVLLKKIRQSQLLQHLNESSTTNNKPSHPSPPARPAQTGPPPPLVKGSQPLVPQKHQYSSGNHSSQLARGIPSQQSHNRGIQQRISQQQRSHGPPPLVMAPTSRGQSHSQLTQRSQQSHHVQSSRNSPQVGQHPAQPELTPAQRQAAAKLALRKQLEKTLLQIPPPKPPPPEMNFIPSLAGNDFMVLVGLEEVVKFIVDIDAQSKGEKGPDVKYVFNPFVCVQCGTDFTPVWKRDKPGSKNVICEQCVTTNQKKALKQEHTNRLKSAFVKALQQEQEIEQRMQAQSASSTSHGESRSERSDKERDRERSDRDRDRELHVREREREHSSHRSSDHDSDARLSRSSHGHSSHGSSHHNSSNSANPVNLSTNFNKATNEQLRQHQNLLHAHQAQLRGVSGLGGMASSFNPHLMFPFSQQHHPTSVSKDLQRQYLLDMIPRSLPGSNVLWRT